MSFDQLKSVALTHVVLLARFWFER
ncbi:hypothetical protein BJ973_001082 [Actinoplanes tereljensis]